MSNDLLTEQAEPMSTEAAVPEAEQPEKIDVSITVVPSKGDQAKVQIRTGESEPYVDVIGNIFKANARDKFLKSAAEKLGCSHEELKHLDNELLAQFAQAREAQNNQSTEETNGSDFAESEKLLAEASQEVRDEAVAFLENKNLLDELLQDFHKLGIVGEMELALAVYMIGTSRVNMKPLGGLVQSASATGKTYVTDIVVSMMPPESTERITGLTANSLYYYTRPGQLRHKFLVIGERPHDDPRGDAAANVGLVMRELFTSGKVSKLVPMKDPETDRLETQRLEMEGPIALLQSTTQQDVHDEDANRMLLLSTDESVKQTRAIIEATMRQAAGKGADAAEIARILEKHRTAQRMLKPLEVTIPYAEAIEFPITKVTARRAVGQLLGCIRAVALLRQMQNRVKTDCIRASLADYDIAREIMEPVLRRVFAPVSEKAMELLKLIQKKADMMTDEFTVRQVTALSSFQGTTIRNRLKELEDSGYIIAAAPHGQGKKGYYKLATARSVKSKKILLTAGELKARWDELRTLKKKEANEQGKDNGEVTEVADGKAGARSCRKAAKSA